MARYKNYNYAQMKVLPVSFERQILPGTFEHTLNRLIDEDFDLEVFEHFALRVDYDNGMFLTGPIQSTKPRCSIG